MADRRVVVQRPFAHRNFSAAIPMPDCWPQPWPSLAAPADRPGLAGGSVQAGEASLAPPKLTVGPGFAPRHNASSAAARIVRKTLGTASRGREVASAVPQKPQKQQQPVTVHFNVDRVDGDFNHRYHRPAGCRTAYVRLPRPRLPVRLSNEVSPPAPGRCKPAGLGPPVAWPRASYVTANRRTGAILVQISEPMLRGEPHGRSLGCAAISQARRQCP